MRFGTRSLGLILATLMLAITACGAAATATPEGAAVNSTAVTSGGQRVLKVAMTFLDEVPDPYQAGWLAVPTGISETLFKLGDDLRPEPWLATGATQVGPTIWEITLREGVKFHNGVVMDAAKVKGSLDLAVLRRPGTKVLLDIDRIEVKDPTTVVIHTNSPNPIMPGLLTNYNTGIADPDTVPASTDDSAERAAMTGPYRVVSFTADRAMTVEAHAGYWQGTPAMDRVEYVAFTDSNTRLIALQSGDVDISINLSPQGAVVVGNDSSLEVRTAPPSGMLFMFVNHESPTMQDPLVRRAIAIAVDREAMSAGVADGKAVPAETMFPPGFLSCQDSTGYSYDPEAARLLLAEAGYEDVDGDGIVEKDGKALELVLQTYPERPLLPPMLEAFQSMLQDIGVGAKVQIVEWTLASQGGYDLFGYSNGTTTTGDPQWAFTKQYLTGGDENRGNFSNARVDELIGQLTGTSDPAQRRLVACEALQKGQDEVALIPVMFPNRLYGISDAVDWTSGPQASQFYFIDHLIGLK
ncbi:MAG: ABC transporter substrate-binding protein [Dehalococcoidia bacterium]